MFQRRMRIIVIQHQLLLLLLIINAIVHILFASAVARDAGQLNKRKTPTVFVSGLTWAFATLVGGVFVAVSYWFVHYSSWARKG